MSDPVSLHYVNVGRLTIFFLLVSSVSYSFISLSLPSCELLEHFIGFHFWFISSVLSISQYSFLSGCSISSPFFLNVVIPSIRQCYIFCVHHWLWFRQLMLGSNLWLTTLSFQHWKHVPLPSGLHAFWCENHCWLSWCSTKGNVPFLSSWF